MMASGHWSSPRRFFKKPSRPIAELGNKEIRQLLPAWVRTLRPDTAVPGYGDPAKRPAFWSADVPYALPSKKPADFNGVTLSVLTLTEAGKGHLAFLDMKEVIVASTPHATNPQTISWAEVKLQRRHHVSALP
ncbi:PREDICTED: uncharacterized protein LOC109470442 [Branchiostoma belcheri]|uniref:Uncharacterized protein LOC109470442 n=1 Tax=Branchiostoma belcheri TaxID=7741 RepID=A0A6P4YT79_BRABE|nr:PREDICTED: uncharacterized protein LOC109470442 [Branchiostoma belcheri]